MTYPILVLAHLVGALLLGAGIVGGIVAGERARRARSLAELLAALRLAARSRQRVLLPGVVLLVASGSWLIAGYHGGWRFLSVPWLAGMVLAFVAESVRANTLARHHVVCLERTAEQARSKGRFTAELDRLRSDRAASFGRLLEATMFVLMLALGVVRPTQWTSVAVGSIVAVLAAAAAAAYVSTPGDSAASLFSNASVDGDGRD